MNETKEESHEFYSCGVSTSRTTSGFEICGQVRAAGVANWRTRLKTVTAAHSKFNLKVFVKTL
jgi:hypothetical protein